MDRFCRLTLVFGLFFAGLGCATRPAPPLPVPFADQVCREDGFRLSLPQAGEVLDEEAARDLIWALRREWGASGEDPGWVDLGVRWDTEGSASTHPFRSNFDADRAWEVAERLEPLLRAGPPNREDAHWVPAHEEEDGTIGLRLHVRLTGLPPIRPMASEHCLPHRHHTLPPHRGGIQLSRAPRPGSTASSPVFRLTLDASGEVVALEEVAGPTDDTYRRLAREAMEAMRWDPGLVNGEPRPSVTYWRVGIPLSVREAASAEEDVSPRAPSPPPRIR